MLECVESKFPFNRYLRQGSVEAPRLWQKMAMQLLANVQEILCKKSMGVLWDLVGQKTHQKSSFMWADPKVPGTDADGSDSGS